MPNFQARAQIQFHIRLRPILVESVASCFIGYPNVPCYLFWVGDTDIKQTARRTVWEDMCVSITQAAFYCVRSLLQALHTSSGYADSLYAHCTQQRKVRSVASSKLEVSGRKW